MPETVVRMHGTRVLVCAPDGPRLQDEGTAMDLIVLAMEHDAGLVLIPAQRLTDAFFTLRTGVAGAIVQKFVTYRQRLVVVGDISPHLAASAALRDFVREANRGDQVWFVASVDELDGRLATRVRRLSQISGVVPDDDR